jgi:hypothetical protein
MCVRAATVVLTAAISTACAASGSWPRIVSVEAARGQPTLRGEWIATYDDALVSIAAIMTGQLGLPRLQATLHFYPDREAFRAGLEADGYSPAFARETAAALSAVSGFRRVLIDERSMDEVSWLFRVALLAHELTHTLQYEWSGGSRGTSDQWLREGFAEWVEVEVLVRLGFTTRAEAHRVLLGRLRGAGVARLPTLSQMVTFPDWVRLAQGMGQEAIYGHAMLATEFLLERQGVSAAIRSFELFGASDDRAANFQRAFGLELSESKAAFNERLSAMLR